ncbi:MAG: PIN domain protein [Candidatus Argoarchaeum ethanivorans]|uniref:PIN domain protein n=1 Tax=Candidatus Argoarchaeum ethanivorans TaxID=2608793 RepID=A0A811TBI1_9EURY|nr:MAG: PIN domain protein [Candidatus Argoarchaeum ethanivorans]
MIIIDSNMWIYYFDESLEEHKYVKEQIREIIMREEGILTNTIVIQEVAHYLIRHEPENEFWEDMNYITRLRSQELVNFDFNLMQEALKLLSKYWNYGIGGRDAVLVATMVMKGVNEIMTHDGAFKNLESKIDEIDNFHVIDPVPERNDLVNKGET